MPELFTRTTRIVAMCARMGVVAMCGVGAACQSGGSATTHVSQPADASRESSGGASGATAGGVAEAPDVRLEALAAERPEPRAGHRNLFRFKPPPPPPPPAPVVREAPRPFVPPVPIGPPPLPQITLKLVLVVQQGDAPRIAYLADGLGRQVPAREGETVEGRYKVLRIAERSIEMSYLDGRGRQTIRMGN